MTKRKKNPKRAGRKTKFKPEYCNQVMRLCLLGATDLEMAKFFSVTEQTFNNWKKSHPEFFESIKAGKEDADCKVARSLYKTALDGNTTAQIFWLKNRRKNEWRDKHEIDHTTGGEKIEPTKIVFEDR